MGEVWVANQQEPVRRQVALKVIKPGLGTARLLARFDQERQTLALMDHPGIGKVLDAGVDHGRPFFAMELIDGAPITRYCDDAPLSVRERLELFVPVCQAVQHAHQKGIIHRDLKPPNILVTLYDGKPVPKVIDFGIAKATGPEGGGANVSTEVGTVLGTLEYMSPEQAEANDLDIDTRSDIYSLGVVLYELLTGGVPFSRQQLQALPLSEMLRIIKEVAPPTPSARLSTSETLPSVAAARRTEPNRLEPVVRGELDWIVMKCLEKDRDRRYETANALAMDLRRYLADEPVLAGPPATGYRLRKYAKKYRVVLATAAAFAALLVVATVSSIGLASWALRERSHAEEQRQEAEANFQRALEAVDKMLTRVSEARLLHVPQMELVRRDLLQDALRFYQEFLRERGDSPAVRREAAKAYKRVGDIQVQLGHPGEGEEAYGQAVALLENLLDESPGDPSLLNELAAIHSRLGILYRSTKRRPRAEAALARGVALLEPRGPEGSFPIPNRYTLASIHVNQVMFYRETGDLGKAEAAFGKGKKLLEDLLAGDPGNGKYLYGLAACHQNVGLVYGAKGSTREAEAAHQKAVDVYQQLVRNEPEEVSHRKGLAQALNNLGLLYTQTRQHGKAEAPYQQSLDLNKAIFDDHPKVVAFRVDLAGSYGNMASHVRRVRSAEESLEWTARALSTLEPALKQDPGYLPARTLLFDTLMGRGYALVNLDRHEDAAKEWRRAVEISEGQPHISMRLYRPFVLVHLAEHARAAAEVEALLAEGHGHGRNLFLFACAHSLCSAVAAADARLPLPAREKLADKYGGRAVELLRKARAVGYFQDPGHLTRLKESKHLKRVSSRSDFQGLLAELEALKDPGGKSTGP